MNIQDKLRGVLDELVTELAQNAIDEQRVISEVAYIALHDDGVFSSQLEGLLQLAGPRHTAVLLHVEAYLGPDEITKVKTSEASALGKLSGGERRINALLQVQNMGDLEALSAQLKGSFLTDMLVQLIEKKTEELTSGT